MANPTAAYQAVEALAFDRRLEHAEALLQVLNDPVVSQRLEQLATEARTTAGFAVAKRYATETVESARKVEMATRVYSKMM